MANINLQGTGSGGLTLDTPSTPNTGLQVSSSPNGNSGNINLQGAQGTAAVPGITQSANSSFQGNPTSGTVPVVPKRTPTPTISTPATDTGEGNYSMGGNPAVNTGTNNQSYSFANGNTYDGNGNLLGTTGTVTGNTSGTPSMVQLSPGAPMTVPGAQPGAQPTTQPAIPGTNGSPAANSGSYTTPVSADVSSTTDTNALSGDPTTNSDIDSLISTNLNNQNNILGSVSQYIQDPNVIAAQKAAQDANLAVQQNQVNLLAGYNNIYAKPIGMDFQQGQQAAITRDNALTGAALGIQAQAAQNALTNAQTSQNQKLQAAEYLFNSNQSQLNQTISLYSQTAPQNIATNYNQFTGDVTITTRNPITGQVSNVNAGNIGKQQNYTSTSVQDVLGVPTFIGVNPDGSVTQLPLANINPAVNGNTPSTTEPTYTPSGSPQAGLTTAGAVLGNWVHGGTTTAASSGYTNAVAQTYQQITGQPLTASTPTSQLAANIPALAQGIAVAEGWNDPNSSQHQLNNPGNIIWAGQANATPVTIQTSSGPKVFASFSTEQDGWNAMYDLLAKKVGATQTSAGYSSQTANATGTQAEINSLATLAPQLFGAKGQNIKKTTDGHYYLDTTQLSGQNATDAQSLLNARSTDITALNPNDVQKVQSISTTQEALSNLSALVKQLPTSGTDPQRLLNVIAGNLGVQVGKTPADTVAAINNQWSTLIGEVNDIMAGNGVTGSRLITSPLISGSVPNASSIQSIANTLIGQANTNLSNVENNIFGYSPPLDYSGGANAILNGSAGTGSQDPTYNALSNDWDSILNATQAN